MPTSTATDNNNSSQILNLLFRAEKAGAGSRGGHPWIDARGKVRYGPKPNAVKPVAATAQVIVPQNQNTSQPGKVLNAIRSAINTGTDQRGNKLSIGALSKLRTLATGLQSNLRSSIKKEIAEKAQAHLPFTVFKDAKGQYRWVGVSSSAAQDADGETVSQKALTEDVARKDVTRDYGPLNWWHTPIRLGTCDFNAMDGPLLVESGTFINDWVAVAVAKGINEGKFKPAMSLEFEHNEPGPPVLPGRVFKRINRVGRALLPAEKASNLLTSFKVYSLKSAAPAGDETKGSNKEMLTEEKMKVLEAIMPPDLLEGLLEGNQTAIKMAEAANYSFKAMTPPMAKDVINVAQTPAATQPPAKVTAKDDGVMVPGMEAETPAEDLAEGGEEEGGYEDSPADMQADAIMQGLYDKIDAIVLSRLKAASSEILAAVNGLNATATASKETSDALAGITLALKENASAFEKVLGENKALKERLDALEGVQPAGVRARASQQGGLSAKQLDQEHADLVATEKENQDPYLKIIQQLGLAPAPRG